MREKKTEKTFTLSTYAYGKHSLYGPSYPSDIDEGRFDFAETLLQIKKMIQFFNNWPLGTKIKVTMEAQEENDRKSVRY